MTVGGCFGVGMVRNVALDSGLRRNDGWGGGMAGELEWRGEIKLPDWERGRGGYSQRGRFVLGLGEQMATPLLRQSGEAGKA